MPTLDSCADCRIDLERYRRLARVLCKLHRRRASGRSGDTHSRASFAHSGSAPETRHPLRSLGVGFLRKNISAAAGCARDGRIPDRRAAFVFIFLVQSLFMGIPIGNIPNDLPTDLIQPARDWRAWRRSRFRASSAAVIIPAYGCLVRGSHTERRRASRGLEDSLRAKTIRRFAISDRPGADLLMRFRPELNSSWPGPLRAAAWFSASAKSVSAASFGPFGGVLISRPIPSSCGRYPLTFMVELGEALMRPPTGRG